MPQVPTTPDRKVPGSPRAVLLPPEETLWKRYSPHHEFTLSGATSTALHLLALGVLLLLGWIWLQNRPETTSDVPAVEPVMLDHGKESVSGHPKGGGGGGNNGKGVDAGEPREDAGEESTIKGNAGELPADQTLQDPAEAPLLEIPSVKGGSRPIVSGTVLKDLGDVGRKAYAVLAQRQAGASGKGSKGTDGGSGGGKDKGKDKGVGEGPKGDVAARRAQRQLRWRLIFNRDSNGVDFRDKLIALGGILVVAEFQTGANGRPIADNRGQARLIYRKVIRNLQGQPVKIGFEDVRRIPGIFWIDDRRESVGALAKALGIPAPPLFACFFSSKVEDELRKLEREHYKGPEENIYETYFHVDLIDGESGYRLECDKVLLKRK